MDMPCVSIFKGETGTRLTLLDPRWKKKKGKAQNDVTENGRILRELKLRDWRGPDPGKRTEGHGEVGWMPYAPYDVKSIR